ncbi:MAG: hypothetical protein OHK0040_10100 [bacterium]
MDFIYRTINSYVHDYNGKEIIILSQLSDFAHIFEVKLKIDLKTKKIIEANGAYHKTPYSICNDTLPLVSKLEGLTVKQGILKEIAHLLSGKRGCVHLFELVENAVKLASTILIGKHINYFSKEFQKLPDDEKIRKSKGYLKNTCLAYSDTEDK